MSAREQGRRIRVLIAKPGLDGHDVGAKLVCRALVEAGMEVIYTGLRQSPAAIAKAALEEGAHVVGLSVLSGAHVQLCRAVKQELARVGLDDVVLMIGGSIPEQDRVALGALGIAGIFPTSTPFPEIVRFIEEHAGRARP